MSDDDPAPDPGGTAGESDGGSFAADQERARDLLADDDVDGLYAAVVSGDEFEYVFAHSGGDPETVGMQAMGLLAHHVGAMVEETGQPPAQVAGDAAMLARTLGITGEESLADVEAELAAEREAERGGEDDEPGTDGPGDEEDPDPEA